MANKTMPGTIWLTESLGATQWRTKQYKTNDTQYIRLDLVHDKCPGPRPVIEPGSWTILDGLTETEASAVCAAYGRSVGFSDGHNQNMMIVKESGNPYRSAKLVESNASINPDLQIRALDILAALPKLLEHQP